MKSFIWKWPNANNLSYYERNVLTAAIPQPTPIVWVRSNVVAKEHGKDFWYAIEIVYLPDHTLDFKLLLVYDDLGIRYTRPIASASEFTLAQQLAIIHADKNFVNPNFSQ